MFFSVLIQCADGLALGISGGDQRCDRTVDIQLFFHGGGVCILCRAFRLSG
jgi:hypothetical protein